MRTGEYGLHFQYEGHGPWSVMHVLLSVGGGGLGPKSKY